MPLLLNQSDLRPLVTDDQALDDAITAVQESLLGCHAGEHGTATFTGLTLATGDELATFSTATPAGPASMRIFPHTSTATRKNQHLGIRIDGQTGEITALIALDDINVLRTSVPAALGVRYLAPHGAETLAILGSGAQAHSHARTFARVLPDLRTVRVWSPTAGHRKQFAEDLADNLGADVVAVDSARDAVYGADVITAAGRYPGRQPALEDASWVRPGALFVSVTFSGGNLVAGGARLVVPTAARPELVAAGFANGFLRGGQRSLPSDATQLADIINADTEARVRPDETIVYELASPYRWDVPILDWVLDWTARTGAGTRITLSES